MINMLRRFARRRWETLLWAAVFGFIGWRIWPQVAAAIGVTAASTASPPFQLTTLDGTAVSDQQLRGKVVLVNFWATWCPPCRVEMPGFQRAYEKFKDEDFVVLGVAMDAGGADAVRRFLDDRRITYPVAMATPSMVRDFGGVRFLPTSFLIDRDGRIRHEVSGIFASVTLDQAVRRLIDEPRRAAPGGTRGER
ncbi:MAG TPA: TlpA disulfide reductase family protein [Gemmatimonadaceae bacterium]|nr:TlpA disulfide reductase family protein [Gemmatimonadaceae bacterium]